MLRVVSSLLVFGAILSPSSSLLFPDDGSSSSLSGPSILELPSVMSNVLSNPVLKGLTGNAKSNAMINLLKQQTSLMQAPFLSVLNRFGVESTPFWITNKISMKNLNVPAQLALKALPGVFNIREPYKAKLIDPIQDGGNGSIISGLANAEWGVMRIGADKVWGTTDGEGVLVANIDTGVLADHPDLVDNYAGQWHDSIDHRSEPYDDNGHGTHVMGTICGKNGIGVAPGARWVACKGLGEQGGDETTLTECAQWILNLEEKPAVVANSWGGGRGQSWFDDQINAWRAANIVPVFAIGNSGSACGSANSPGDRKGVISVGATTSSNSMASFSSRGKARGTGMLKPEVSAPGHQIRSAWNNGGYNTISGTSMACPHVAGAVALLKASNPNLSIDNILSKLQNTANKSPKVSSTDLNCGPTSSNRPYPNNAYGHGIINVAKAMGLA